MRPKRTGSGLGTHSYETVISVTVSKGLTINWMEFHIFSGLQNEEGK